MRAYELMVIISGKLEEIFGPRSQWPEAMAVKFVDGQVKVAGEVAPRRVTVIGTG